MRYVFLFLVLILWSFNCAFAFSSAEESHKKAVKHWNAGDTTSYQNCLKKAEQAIADAAKSGDFDALVELDYAPGFTADKVVKFLKSKGYKAINLEVGGLQGTSFHVFIQVSW